LLPSVLNKGKKKGNSGELEDERQHSDRKVEKKKRFPVEAAEVRKKKKGKKKKNLTQKKQNTVNLTLKKKRGKKENRCIDGSPENLGMRPRIAVRKFDLNGSGRRGEGRKMKRAPATKHN